MYLIDITINTELVTHERAEELLAGHRAWFTSQAEAGHFLVVGPYRDRAMAGVVMAQAESRDALEAIIAQDAYYPEMATYDVHEFQANLISDKMIEYRGK